MTVEIHNPELESILEQQLKTRRQRRGNAPANISRRATPADEQRNAKALEAAARIHELRKGVTLERPEGVSLREYAHIGRRY